MNASSVGAHPHTYTHAHPTHVHARASCAPRKQTMRCGLSAIPSATARLTQNISLVGVPCCANAGCRLAVISRSPPLSAPVFSKKHVCLREVFTGSNRGALPRSSRPELGYLVFPHRAEPQRGLIPTYPSGRRVRRSVPVPAVPCTYRPGFGRWRQALGGLEVGGPQPQSARLEDGNAGHYLCCVGCA